MRVAVWLIAGALVLAAIYGVWSGTIGLPAAAPSCARDEELDADWRRGPEARGDAFLAALQDANTKAAYGQLSAELTGKLTEDEFATASLFTLAGLKDLKLQHTHRPRGEGEVSCAVSGPDGATAAITSSAAKTQAHLLYTAKTPNNDWAVTLMLAEEDGAWKVAGFFRSMTSMAGLYTRDLIKLAEAQAAKGSAFNAFMLASTATYRADRGGDFRLGVKAEADAALAKIAAPTELTGGPPFNWTLDGTRFLIEDVSVMNEAKLALVIVHVDPTWDGKDTAGAEARNRRLIDAFVKAHPDYKEVFGMIVARMNWPGQDRAWATVFDAETGYEKTPAKPAE